MNNFLKTKKAPTSESDLPEIREAFLNGAKRFPETRI